MLRPLEFDPETEAAVRFVEDTDPAEIVANTLERLRAGETRESLVALQRWQSPGRPSCRPTSTAVRYIRSAGCMRC